MNASTDTTSTPSARASAGKPAGEPVPLGAGDSPPPLVSVRDLRKHFPIHGGLLRRRIGTVKAVDGVSFDIPAGETLGLVGESGCGKSTVGRSMLRLHDVTAGDVRIADNDVANATPAELRRLRPSMQMIFQDPQASLNPRMTLGEIIGEPLREHVRPGHGNGRAERRARVHALMDQVGLAREFAARYPHEFSGGQRQRIGIARALALEPRFIVCDEPIAALDVSIQAQVVNLLEELQDRLGLTYLFISHDLGMVRHIADRVAVMYLGRIVELAARDALYAEPLHPYTRALLSAVPEPDPAARGTVERIVLRGDVPSPASPPVGCNFCTRCPEAMPVCERDDPPTREVRPGRLVACHLYAEPGAETHRDHPPRTPGGDAR